MTDMKVIDPKLVLYRVFGQDGELLYVGKSINAWRRFNDHRRKSKFYVEAETIHLTRAFSSEAELLAAEAEAIRSEHPRDNVVYNGGSYQMALMPPPRPAPPVVDEVKLEATWKAGEWNPVELFQADIPEEFFDDKLVRVYRGGKLIAQGIVNWHAVGCELCDEISACFGFPDYCNVCSSIIDEGGERPIFSHTLCIYGEDFTRASVRVQEINIQIDTLVDCVPEFPKEFIEIYVWVTNDQECEITNRAREIYGRVDFDLFDREMRKHYGQFWAERAVRAKYDEVFAAAMAEVLR